MLKTKRTPHQIASTKAKADAILARSNNTLKKAEAFSMEGVIGVNGKYYDMGPDPDHEADRLSELAEKRWIGIAPSPKQVGQTSVAQVIEVDFVPDAQPIRVVVEHHQAS